MCSEILMAKAKLYTVEIQTLEPELTKVSLSSKLPLVCSTVADGLISNCADNVSVFFTSEGYEAGSQLEALYFCTLAGGGGPPITTKGPAFAGSIKACPLSYALLASVLLTNGQDMLEAAEPPIPLQWKLVFGGKSMGLVKTAGPDNAAHLVTALLGAHFNQLERDKTLQLDFVAKDNHNSSAFQAKALVGPFGGRLAHIPS
ncbi:uncharacterized protein B0H18DRAFT_950987 [Fomitopsis serialis]|uniref:uncharacterized protein n=1 Tax=Fomitopsis serialis TaxID=139415 RepID=UPI002007D2D0|nr:uncharacterized protein B0H18DRAFT_950987 [Neoantrodia serialis]KAH9935435.1 hypothetical protein B0H18DRAFT_950987 [Neoantrodia serialis]